MGFYLICTAKIYLMSTAAVAAAIGAARTGNRAAPVSKKDESWGGKVGMLAGMGPSAIMWALLSENQDALLTQTINQASQHESQCYIQGPCSYMCHNTLAAAQGKKANSSVSVKAINQICVLKICLSAASTGALHATSLTWEAVCTLTVHSAC